MVTTTRAQREQLWKLYKRQNWIKQHRQSYYEFRKTVVSYFSDRCIMVVWCGMVVGIETDGYPHT